MKESLVGLYTLHGGPCDLSGCQHVRAAGTIWVFPQVVSVWLCLQRRFPIDSKIQGPLRLVIYNTYYYYVLACQPALWSTP